MDDFIRSRAHRWPNARVYWLRTGVCSGTFEKEIPVSLPGTPWLNGSRGIAVCRRSPSWWILWQVLVWNRWSKPIGLTVNSKRLKIRFPGLVSPFDQWWKWSREKLLSWTGNWEQRPGPAILWQRARAFLVTFCHLHDGRLWGCRPFFAGRQMGRLLGKHQLTF